MLVNISYFLLFSIHYTTSLTVQLKTEMQADRVTIKRRNVTRGVVFTSSQALSQSVRPILSPVSARRDACWKIVSTAIRFFASTQEELDRSSKENATVDGFLESVTAFREALEVLEERDFHGDDVFDPEDLEDDVRKILRSITDSFDAILATFEFVPSKGLSISSSSRRPLMAEKQQVITSSVEQLNWLLLKVQR